jgi:hypothetical protein
MTHSSWFNAEARIPENVFRREVVDDVITAPTVRRHIFSRDEHSHVMTVMLWLLHARARALRPCSVPCI